jgi:hypothetical protein
MTVRTHLISPTAPDHLSDETGAYSYGLGHQMKPQRIRMTHELVMAYGMLEKLHVIVGLQICGPQKLRRNFRHSAAQAMFSGKYDMVPHR